MTVTLYPEAIRRDDIKEPGPWSVTHASSEGYTVLAKKQLVAPLMGQACTQCGHDHARGIRQHEMAHVAFTPTNLHSRARRAKVSDEIMQGVEDARIGWRLEHEGMPAAPPLCPDTIASAFAPALSMQNYPLLVSKIAAGFCTPETRETTEAWVRDAIDADDHLYMLKHVLYELYRLQRGRPDSKRGIQAMKTLQTYADAMTHNAQERAAEAERQAAQAQEHAVGRGDGAPAKGGHVNVPGSGNADSGPDGYGPLWHPMHVEEPRRDRPARRMPIRRWSHRDEGCIPSAMHRLVSDGRIFKVPSHKQGQIALLIDGSSSMSWDVSDLRQLLEAAPASTVAIYCRGQRGDDDATLLILARNGRRVDDHYLDSWNFGSNACDGLALRWLAKQPGRRIWLSDGEVNGQRGGPKLAEDCRAVVKAAEIMRVDRPAEAIAVAAGRARHIPSRTPCNRRVVANPLHS